MISYRRHPVIQLLFFGLHLFAMVMLGIIIPPLGIAYAAVLAVKTVRRFYRKYRTPRKSTVYFQSERPTVKLRPGDVWINEHGEVVTL